MSQQERYGNRDLTYSAWHRSQSTARFLEMEGALAIPMIDIDCCEYDNATKQPVALIETAKYIGQDVKCGTVTRNLARRAGIPAYIALYVVDPASKNPANPTYNDIFCFKVRQVCPVETDWELLMPWQWAEKLLGLRGRRPVRQGVRANGAG